jgi:hypothetical protein
VTEEEREVSPVDLAGTLDEAVKAGLRLRLSDDHEIRLGVRCPGCAEALAMTGQPWDPVLAVRRLERFISSHRDHAGRHGTGEEEW